MDCGKGGGVSEVSCQARRIRGTVTRAAILGTS